MAIPLIKRLLPPLWMISLLLAAVMGAIWIRGYRVEDSFRWGMANRADTVSRWFHVSSSQGIIWLAWDRLAFDHAIPHFASAAESFPDGRELHWTETEDSNERSESLLWTRDQFAHGSMQKQGTTVPLPNRPLAQLGNKPLPGPVSASYENSILHFPWWSPILLCGIFPALRLWRVRRDRKRRRRGQCVVCGYDLRQSPDRCPECGTSILATRQPMARARRTILVTLGAAMILVYLRVSFPNLQELRRHQAPSWLNPDDLIKQNDQKSLVDIQSELLSISANPLWFIPHDKSGTEEESDAYDFRIDRGKYLRPVNVRLDRMFPYTFFPTTSGQPRDPMSIPMEQDGVRLTLSAAPSSTAGELLFTVGMSSRERNIELEQPPGFAVPFLFSFYMDGQAMVFPPSRIAMMELQRSRVFFVTLTPAGSSQTWRYRIDEQSIRRLMPDSKPHTLDIFAAFSDDQFEFYHGENERTMHLIRMRDPKYPDQLLIRSNGVRLIWTGSQWQVGHFPDEEYRR